MVQKLCFPILIFFSKGYADIPIGFVPSLMHLVVLCLLICIKICVNMVHGDGTEDGREGGLKIVSHISYNTC